MLSLSLCLSITTVWIHVTVGLQRMDCGGVQSCQNDIVTCPENDDCQILCGLFGCYSAKIICPTNYECTMCCYEAGSCISVDVNASQSTKLKFKGCTQSKSCYGMTVRCPQNDNGIKNCIMTGNGEFGGDMVLQMTLYAVNAWNDIDLTNVTTTNIYGTMHCNGDFSKLCDFDGSWTCDCDGDHINNRSADNILIVDVLIPLFIISIVGLCCSLYIFKKRGTWWTKEEIRRRSKFKESGQHEKVDSDEDDEDEEDVEETDNQYDVKNWFLNEVGLNDIDNNTYYDLFVLNGFDELISIKSITDKDLMDIGVVKLGHRKRILFAAKQI